MKGDIVLILFSILLFSQCAAPSRITTYGGIGKDKSLYYYHTGTGEPIILVHGGPGLNHSYFLPSMNRLSSTYHLIYYDQKSCGQAEIPVDTTSMRLNAFVHDIESVRLKFGLKKFHLMGHSWGTMLAARYAIQYPDQLSSLILVSPAAFSSNDVREASKVMNGRFDYTDQIHRNEILESAEFKNGSPKAMEKLFKLGFRINMVQKNMIDSLQLKIPDDYAKRNAALKYLYQDLYDYDIYPFLKDIRVPTLIIEGDQDAGRIAAEKIRTHLPQSKYELIKDCGHFPFIEQPVAFAAALKSFVSMKSK